MITAVTNVYTLIPTFLEGDRLDFVFQHPDFEQIRRFRQGSTKLLGEVITKPQYGLCTSGLDDGVYGFLNVQHLTPYGQIIFDPPAYVQSCAEDSLLRQNDILIARTGHTLGKAALIREEYQGYAFGSFCIRFAIRENAEDRPEFLMRFLNSPLGQSQILMLKTGSGKYNINSEQIRDIRIPRFSGDFQDKLVEAIMPLEAQALEAEREARSVRAEADAMLLTQLGFLAPTSHEVTFFFKTASEGCTIFFSIQSSELRDRLHYLFYHPRNAILTHFQAIVPTVPLVDICAEKILRGDQPIYEEDGCVIVLKTVNLKSGWIDYDNALHVTQEFYNSHPNSQIRHGDVLIASTGYVSMGKVDVFDRDEPAIIDGHVSRVRLQDDYDPQFVAHFLRSSIGKLQINKWFTGSSGQIELQPCDLGKFIVPANSNDGVPLHEQKRIAEPITVQLDKAHELEKEAEKKWQEAREVFETMILDDT